MLAAPSLGADWRCEFPLSCPAIMLAAGSLLRCAVYRNRLNQRTRLLLLMTGRLTIRYLRLKGPACQSNCYAWVSITPLQPAMRASRLPRVIGVHCLMARTAGIVFVSLATG